MSPLLSTALEEARLLAFSRPWILPSDNTLAEAERLLALVISRWPEPDVLVEPDGSVSLEWEAGEQGWLTLAVAGSAEVTHSAVIEGDEYGQVEPFGSELPDWAAALLRRLFPPPH
ncbi:hypothetical protein OOT46_14885 [Aquabacterium sp. A7-Y]|uniref:hypothetical protein n=1 Tax=Aquabacterium sp. A7-Y TaxID=1349605 RepID=UPI00223CD9F7|nr:hypothetical protein [Aquabacterium sp. A7-Y]MCW7539127.1 hypothetical protein [Aquabacterium sp. A7-Y]